MDNHYLTLGVSASATPWEIKGAFLTLAQRYHPDKNPYNPEAARHFIQAAEAYNILRDPDTRNLYDRRNPGSGNRFGGFGFSGERKPPQFSDYVLMDMALTYAQGVHALRAACVVENNLRQPKYQRPDGRNIPRPFTCKEGAVARLTDFNTLTNPDGSARSLDDRLLLSSQWNDSCTGIAKKAGTTKYKIVPLCWQLLMIDKEFKGSFLEVPYNSFDVQELDSSDGTHNHPLPKDQIIEQEGWRFSFEEDIPLLRNYIEMVFTAIELLQGEAPERGMSFFVQQKPSTDELRALLIYSLFNNSDAIGHYDLNGPSSFVRISPSKICLIESGN